MAPPSIDRSPPASTQHGSSSLPDERRLSFSRHDSSVAENVNHGRRVLAVGPSWAQKIPGFFGRISNRCRNCKPSNKENYLQKSKTRSISEFLRGLENNNPAEVHQGLKRLHTAENELKNRGGEIGMFHKDAYVSDTLRDIIRELHNNDAAVDLWVFDDFFYKALITQHSERNKFFHRMLVRLDNFGLMPFKSYFKERVERITKIDDAIESSLTTLSKNVLGISANCFLKEERRAARGLAHCLKNMDPKDPERLYLEGRCFQKGWGQSNKSALKAANSFLDAEKLGHPEAARQLARCLKNMDPKDPKMLDLKGRCFEGGWGLCEQNEQEANKCFMEAKKLEHPLAGC